MTEISGIIINEVSGIHVICGDCKKSHFGRQTYFDANKLYVCDDCLNVLNGKMKWISVKDRLPEPNNWKIYAVLTDEYNLYRHQVAYYSTSKEWLMECDQRKPIKVTHWIELPRF